jgi:hypothetical protein
LRVKLWYSYRLIIQHIMTDELQHMASTDEEGNPLSGNKNYQMHLSPGIPVCKFWSILVYDNETGLIIKTEQPWPSVHSKCTGLLVNPDGSVDAWFGPDSPPGKEFNWVMTIPGKNWNLIFRLYGLAESWKGTSWKPGNIIQLE